MGDGRRATELKRNIWKLYVFSFLRAFTLFAPVVVLFFLENSLSMTEVMILQSAYSVAVVGLEVPSGHVSDVIGRRKTLIAASFFLATGIGIYSLGHGFWGFLAGELTFAVGGALRSGADSALMYDTLSELGLEDRYKKLWGKSEFYALISGGAASILGGLVGEVSLRLTLSAMVPIFLAMIPLTYSMREPERRKNKAEEGHFREIISVGKETFLHNNRLRWLIVYSAIIMILIKGGYFLYQPYFKEVSIPVAYFGVIFAGMNAVSALSSKYAEEVEEYLGLRISLISLIVLTGIGYILLGQVGAVFSFVFTGLHQFVRGFNKPVLSDYINKLAESKNRSTVLSFQSLAGRILYASTIPLIGLISDTYGIKMAMNSMALTSFILGGMILSIMTYENII